MNGRVATSTTQVAIKVEGLGKQVPDAGGTLRILESIDFALPAGASAAIVGASGSGKSTLLGLMAGLDVPTEGRVEALGQSLFDLDEDRRAAWRATRVGFVFQTFQLLNQMTAIENVMLPLELAGDRGAAAKAEALLKRVGLADRAHHYPRTLSGGEQQRVALARAFIANPPLLLADEPTGSLDSVTGERIIELMFELNAQAGATLILVTHDAQLAARCAWQLRLERGRMLSFGPT